MVAQVVLFAADCHFAVTLCLQYLRCASCDWRRTFEADGGFEAISLCVMALMYFEGLFTNTHATHEAQLVLFLVALTLYASAYYVLALCCAA